MSTRDRAEVIAEMPILLALRLFSGPLITLAKYGLVAGIGATILGVDVIDLVTTALACLGGDSLACGSLIA